MKNREEKKYDHDTYQIRLVIKGIFNMNEK